MELTNKASKKYIKNVKKHLKCSSRSRKMFIESLSTEISNFEATDSEAQYEDYLEIFGDPKETALEYIKELSSNEKFAYWLPLIGIISIIIVSAFGFIMLSIISQIEASTSYQIESPPEIISEYD